MTCFILLTRRKNSLLDYLCQIGIIQLLLRCARKPIGSAVDIYALANTLCHFVAPSSNAYLHMKLVSFMLPPYHYTMTSFRFADEVFYFIGFLLHIAKKLCGFSNPPYLFEKTPYLIAYGGNTHDDGACLKQQILICQ